MCKDQDLSFFLFILTSLSCDGQYVTSKFVASFHKESEANASSSSEFHLPVSWDPAHYMNLAVLDVRDGKNNFSKDVSQFFARFISRSNLFSTLFGRGKKFSLLKAVVSKKKLPLHMQCVFAAQRLVSHFVALTGTLIENLKPLWVNIILAIALNNEKNISTVSYTIFWVYNANDNIINIWIFTSISFYQVQQLSNSAVD